MKPDTPSVPASPAARPLPSPNYRALHRKAARRVKEFWKQILIIAGVAGLLGWLGHLALHAYRYEETDDAYVTGHLHQISAQINGQVQQVLADDNQTVKAGDGLVRLDPLEFQIARQKATAALAQAKAQLVQATANTAQTVAQSTEADARVSQAEAQRAQTQAQLTLAQLTLSRNERLFAKGGAVTQADVDNARSVFAAAQAALAANNANIAAAHASVGSAAAAQTLAQAQVEAAHASIAVAEAAVREAQRQLDYATIVAPADGRIGNKAVAVGNWVQAGQILFDLVDPDFWVVANFKETQLPLMRPGLSVELAIDALPGHLLHGTIDSIAPASGAQFALLPPDNATGNFNKIVQRVPVKITFDPASVKALGNRLRPGLSVIVNVRVR